jgi:solute carrier family 25 carnitine/acylcarnitine transporter 20/29
MFFSYFAAYEVTKKALTPAGSSSGELNLGAIMFAGGTAGVAMWSIAIPPDVSPRMNRNSLSVCIHYTSPGFEVPHTICAFWYILWIYGLL